MNFNPPPRPPAMLGELPLLRARRWQDPPYPLNIENHEWRDYWHGEGFCSWDAPRDLERVQHLLHKEQEGGEIVLESKHRHPWERYSINTTIPYHRDILPNWEIWAKNLSKRKGLNRLCIDNIVIPTSTFFAKTLMPILYNNNASMTSLELRSCGLEGKDIICVARFLSDNSSLSTLDLSWNVIDSIEAARSLSVAMKNHSELSFVNLSECGLGADNRLLSAVLDGAANLKSLLLESARSYWYERRHKSISIGPSGLSLVADYVAKNTAMTVLSLDGNNLGNDEAKVIGRALRSNTSIRQLCLGGNSIAMPAFLRSDRATEYLTHIDMRNCRIGQPGAKLIAGYLERNPAVIELNLSFNKIPPKGGVFLAEALKHNTTLHHLDLRCNSLSDKCVPAIAGALKSNSTLRTLDLSVYNNIRIDARKELIQSAVCDTSSLSAIAASNHTCKLILCSNTYKNHITRADEMKAINSLEDEGQKIRYKVVLALFTMDTDLFQPQSFVDVPLELMPRLFELVQQEVGYGGFGKDIVKGSANKRRLKGYNPTLSRLYEVVKGWNTPLLFMRGAGKLRKKRKRTRKNDDEEDWLPPSRSLAVSGLIRREYPRRARK